MNEDIENKAGDKVGDLVIHDDLEKNDASTSVEQELQADVGASDSVELDQVHVVNNAHSHANTDSDERINVRNQANDVQAESLFADNPEMKNTSTPSEQELLVQTFLIVFKSIQLIRQLMQMIILVKILMIELMQRV